MDNDLRPATAVRASAPKTVVWSVGPWREGEFAIVRRLADPCESWIEHTQLADALAVINAGALPPEVVLLAQPRPGAESQEAVDRLLAAAPLLRIVAVAGSWCEGELRTGRPLKGAFRIYWHELPGLWRRLQRGHAAGIAPAWSAPVDGAALRFGECLEPGSSRERSQVVHIDAYDVETMEALAAALGIFGWSCRWTPWHRIAAQRPDAAEESAPAAGVWVGGQLEVAELQALGRFCTQFAQLPAPVVTLVDFPRAEHWELARGAGASAVIGKPCSMAALADELKSLVAATRCSLSRPLRRG